MTQNDIPSIDLGDIGTIRINNESCEWLGAWRSCNTTANTIEIYHTQCLICGEPVPVEFYFGNGSPKVCKKCKEAIIGLRKHMTEMDSNYKSPDISTLF